MSKSKLQFLRFGRDIWDPSHRFETSWLLPPWVLFAIRFLISIYAFTVLIFIIIRNLVQHHVGTARLQFSYFTVLCYWGLAFYFLVASLHTFSYALSGGTPLLNRFPRPLQALHYLFYSTICTFPLLVTIVYWAVLYSSFDSTFQIWSNASEHGLNSLFALFEILMTRINPPPWIHLLWLVVLLACYLGLAYLTHTTKHVYVYNFLNPAPKTLNAQGHNVGGVGSLVAAYVVGIAVGICILFCVVRGLIWARKWVTETKMERLGKFYGGREMGRGEVELETQRVWEK